LRKAQTDAEARLWWHLRDRRLGGFKFRRQYPLGTYIVDFLCVERRLIVELDGGQHADQVGYDGDRTRRLNGQGYRVVRFWNDDALLRIESVLESILSHLASMSTTPHPNPLPASGERES
jgi:very-short-patch-repair endonuclease